MPLTESRIRSFIEHAQQRLHLHDQYQHDRDHAYQEALEFVDELIDLMWEVRRERAALEAIAAMWDECTEGLSSEELRSDRAVRMCAIARDALGQPVEPPRERTPT
jgi:hypothetical protein